MRISIFHKHNLCSCGFSVNSFILLFFWWLCILRVYSSSFQCAYTCWDYPKNQNMLKYGLDILNMHKMLLELIMKIVFAARLRRLIKKCLDVNTLIYSCFIIFKFINLSFFKLDKIEVIDQFLIVARCPSLVPESSWQLHHISSFSQISDQFDDDHAYVLNNYSSLDIFRDKLDIRV